MQTREEVKDLKARDAATVACGVHLLNQESNCCLLADWLPAQKPCALTLAQLSFISLCDLVSATRHRQRQQRRQQQPLSPASGPLSPSAGPFWLSDNMQPIGLEQLAGYWPQTGR